MISTSIYSQNNTFSEKRWVILVTDESQHPQLQKQIEAIEANSEAAIERKIGVIQFTKNKSIPLFNVSEDDIIETKYSNLFSEISDFEAILIGLDGGIKLRRKEAIDVKELFDLIDSMPMRQREIRQQNKK